MWRTFTMWRRFIRSNSTDSINYAHRKELISANPRLFYPTIGQLRGSVPTVRLPKFIETFHNTDFLELPNRRSSEQFQLEGKVTSVRKSGKGLYFIDLVQDNMKVQIYTSNKLLNVTKDEFAKTLAFIRKGDHVTCVGHAYKTNTGELSLQATHYVQVASPCLESTTLPDKLRTRKSINSNRVMDYLVDSESRQKIMVRSRIIQSIRGFLVDAGFLEVQTPIISGKGTGANAEPFETVSRFLPRKTEEFSKSESQGNRGKDEGNTEEGENGAREVAQKSSEGLQNGSHEEVSKYEPLQLRVAPELWLKKLVIGGFDKVFEIGSNFRNEGIDATHNPEFLSCEFYRSFTSLEQLMGITEALFKHIYQDLTSVQDQHSILQDQLPQLSKLGDMNFPRYEFIPTIEEKTGVPFPPILDVNSLVEYYGKINLVVPAQRNPANLLDHLSSTFLETMSISQPNTPIFIYNQPSLMSPLAKSTTIKYGAELEREYDISLRFELFINGKEYVNSYEEENSPFDQRDKFMLQQKNKTEFGDLESVVPDWHYVQAMQYGLPPTGGWGCGIDRLAMLYTGATRIEEVLSFGSLKDVIRQ